MIENGIDGDIIGVAFDGTGFGTDETIWGGEFLCVNLKEFRRIAHLKKMPMPGGQMAIKEPWRMALVYLYDAFGEDLLDLNIDLVKRIDHKKWEIIKRMIEKGINTPLTSSMGRLFDAVSSILSIRDNVNHEGQAAIELEMISDAKENETYPFVIMDGNPMIIDLKETIISIVKDLTEGGLKSKISKRFHKTISKLIVETCKVIRSKEGLNRAALSGGVFQNMVLLESAVNDLKESGFEVFIHHSVPTNDGGISLGQVVIAHMRLFDNNEVKIKGD